MVGFQVEGIYFLSIVLGALNCSPLTCTLSYGQRPISKMIVTPAFLLTPHTPKKGYADQEKAKIRYPSGRLPAFGCQPALRRRFRITKNTLFKPFLSFSV